MIIRKLLFITLFFTATGCIHSGGCPETFTVIFKGKVVDDSGDPIEGVVVNVSVLGDPPAELAETDVNGEYYYDWFRAASLGDVYFVFSKDGYSDFTTPSRRVDGCDDLTVVNDATMTP